MTQGPRLDWGRLARFGLGQAAAIPLDLARIWQVARDSAGLVVQPIERFEPAGTLNDHPGHVRSDRAKESFPAIFALAAAAVTAAEPLRSRSRATAAAALLAWARVYRPGHRSPRPRHCPNNQRREICHGTRYIRSPDNTVLVYSDSKWPSLDFKSLGYAVSRFLDCTNGNGKS